jgi:hypothetical protein
LNFANPMTTQYQTWYIVEASVSVMVGNFICCWQLAQKLFKLKAFNERSNAIVTQPAMNHSASLQYANLLSVDGSPKDSRWFFMRKQAREWLGSFISNERTSNGSVATSSTMVELEDMRHGGSTGLGLSDFSGPSTAVNTPDRV